MQSYKKKLKRSWNIKIVEKYILRINKINGWNSKKEQMQIVRKNKSILKGISTHSF